MPIDINALRDYKGGDPAKVRQNQIDRFRPPEWVDEVIAIDKEWRAQFPDDATYISEFSKKEYPSEARAVKRAAALPKSDEKRALAKKGARAD